MVIVIMIFAIIITVEKAQYNVKGDLEAVAIAGQFKSSIDWKVKVNFNKQQMSSLKQPLKLNFNYKYKYRHKYRCQIVINIQEAEAMHYAAIHTIRDIQSF